jgi:hypothetical protein
MTDIFVSYATADTPFAEFLARHLRQEGLTVFLASTSMPAGTRWMPHILENLGQSKWVLCLASRAACASPWVMQEMGAAISANKKLIPIIWDMPRASLPGWMQQYEPVNLAGATQDDVLRSMAHIASSIKEEKRNSAIIGALLLAGLAIIAR